MKTKTKTIYIIWYKPEDTKYTEGPCYEGRSVFWTDSYNKAFDYKKELEDNAVDLDDYATFSIVSFEVTESS